HVLYHQPEQAHPHDAQAQGEQADPHYAQAQGEQSQVQRYPCVPASKEDSQPRFFFEQMQLP
ncbi:hypothetical protein A2U01_0100354, partial [Trifolium medium]|nr:hypothetical protein [Trifolium medium]